MNPLLSNVINGLVGGIVTAGTLWLQSGSNMTDWQTPAIGGGIAVLSTLLAGLQQRYKPIPGAGN